MVNILFLDIDGVLNCQEYYSSNRFDKTNGNYPYNQIDKLRVQWLNNLCISCDLKVVISSTWRSSGIDYCKDVLEKCGSTFEIIDITPYSEERIRGVEIYKWIQNNSKTLGHHFEDYVIIDDDSDMLLWQQHHFFHVDGYSGLTPNTVYKIERFFKYTLKYTIKNEKI